MLKVWEEHFWNDLDYIMDYQIIDHTGDTMITNTGNNLSQLGRISHLISPPFGVRVCIGQVLLS